MDHMSWQNVAYIHTPTVGSSLRSWRLLSPLRCHDLDPFLNLAPLILAALRLAWGSWLLVSWHPRRRRLRLLLGPLPPVGLQHYQYSRVLIIMSTMSYGYVFCSSLVLYQDNDDDDDNCRDDDDHDRLATYYQIAAIIT